MRGRLLGLRWCALALIGLCGVAWAQHAKLESVHVSSSGDRTRVVFALSEAIDPDLFMLRDPARLVVDMPDTARANGTPNAWSGKGSVLRLRSGIRHGDDLRIVLDLAQLDIKPDSYTLLPDERYGNRLVVDLYTHAEQPVSVAAAAQAAQAAQQQQARLQTETEQGLSASTDDEQTASGQQKATVDKVSVETAKAADTKPVAYTPVAPTRDIVVAIDAGHGGHDPGAIGPHGVEEKQVVLAIARKLAAMIDEQPHMHAMLTRDADAYVGLRDRMVKARKADADLFVSVHANASRSTRPHGVSVFALSLGGATSERGRLLAERENAALMVGGVNLEGKDSTLASFMLDLAQSATIDASLDVGRRVLNNLGGFTALLRHEVEQAAFVVLKSPDLPSILVETGFITNPAEARKLQTDAYQTRIASAILRGIKGYFDSYRPGTMIVKGQVHQVRSGETLSEIAQTYHISLSRLREYNDLKGSVIKVGQKLRIPPPGPQQVASLQ